MSAGKIGLAYLGGPAVPAMQQLAKRAEDKGFESVWMAETRISRDGLVPLAAIACETDRMRLGTGIINVFTRGVVVTAVSFATLEELAPGRVVVGLGAGSSAVLTSQGQAISKPLTRLREFVHALRRLLAGGPVEYKGETISLAGAQLECPPRRKLPVYLGVTGSRALELAGEIADGVIINGFMSLEYLGRALPTIEQGFAKAESGAAKPEIAAMLATSLDNDGRRARDAIRPLIANYLRGFPNIARETGVDSSVLKRIRRGDLSAVDDVMVNRLAVAGTPSECRARIEAYREAGVQLPILSPIANVEKTIDALADA